MFDNIMLSIKSKLNYSTIYSQCEKDDPFNDKPKYYAQKLLSNLIAKNCNYVSVKPNDSGYHRNNMLPRVQRDCVKWDPVDLEPKEKFPEELDNVIDKFVRIIQINDKNSMVRFINSFTFKKKN